MQSDILAWEKTFHGLPVRWIAPKNLHITLIPPWEEENIERVIDTLKTVSGFGASEVQFRRVSYGPNPRSPRLIWAEGQTPPALLALKKQLEPLLGQKPQRRDFFLHLTLARFRQEEFYDFPLKKLNERTNWIDQASSLVLMESHLLPDGADYEVITTITL